MINGDRYRIVTKEEKSTLYIKAVVYEDFGFYVCKAINDAGEILTKTKLIESVKAYMIDEDIEQAKMKVEKKLSKKIKVSRKASIDDVTNSSSVNFEATVKSKKSRALKKKTKESVSTSATIKNKRPASSVERVRNEDSQLTISRNQIISPNSSDSEDFDTSKEVIKINSKNDLNEILSSDDFIKRIDNLNFEKFKEFSQSLKEFALLVYMIEKKVDTKDIMTMFQSDFFPDLKSPNLQAALVKLVEKKGFSNFVSDILSSKSEVEIESHLASSIGVEAFLKMSLTEKINIRDVINSLELSDFQIN